MQNEKFYVPQTDTEIPAYLLLPGVWFHSLDLSNDAKRYCMPYSLTGRVFPEKNGYIEPDGTIRLYFTLEEGKENCTEAVRLQPVLFKELEHYGLIVPQAGTRQTRQLSH